MYRLNKWNCFFAMVKEDSRNIEKLLLFDFFNIKLSVKSLIFKIFYSLFLHLYDFIYINIIVQLILQSLTFFKNSFHLLMKDTYNIWIEINIWNVDIFVDTFEGLILQAKNKHKSCYIKMLVIYYIIII